MISSGKMTISGNLISVEICMSTFFPSVLGSQQMSEGVYSAQVTFSFSARTGPFQQYF